MERYRSGHNEAVLKTVCPQGRVGSNPTLSVSPFCSNPGRDKTCLLDESKKVFYSIRVRFDSSNLEKYPSWPKGHPWKGCRSLTAARGFKSLLLRSLDKNVKKLLTNILHYDNIIKLTREKTTRASRKTKNFDN